MGCGGSRSVGPRTDSGQPCEAGKSPAQAPPPSFAELIAAGTVVPDQLEGPYVLASYHANVTGAHRGFKDKASFDKWVANNEEIMAQQTSWATIDFEAEGAVDPVYMFNYGTINGGGLQMSELRKVVIRAQKAMKKAYSKAYSKAYHKRGAAEVYQRIAKVPERRPKVHQPGGAQLDLIGLYKGALSALGGLWEYGQQVVVESGERGVAVSWSLKKAQRIWFKVHTDYDGDVSRVKDCARIALEFATAEGLERAANFVLQKASTFKNRVAYPTDEGYRDLMFTVLIGDHVCEVQLHVVEMIKAKKSGAGHTMYKVCRRVLIAPIVAEDTYCLEVVETPGLGKEPHGYGERNAQGEAEGRGTMVYASGDMYEGQWRAGQRHGQGKSTGATGNVYEGEWVNDQRHGHGKYTFVDGEAYEGEFVQNRKHGRGKTRKADGESYDGEYADNQRHGVGTYTYADGRVEVARYEAGGEVGQGVRWNAGRTEAWELQAGEEARSIPLAEAAEIAKRIGMPPP